MESASTSRSDEVDLISKLPSDVLVSILEKVHLGEAMRVGVLSHRWRSLPHQLPRLALDIYDFLPDEEDEDISYYDEDVVHDKHDAPANSPPDALAEASEAMVAAAEALLASRTYEVPACTLAVSFLLRHNYMSIGHLLDDAMASGKVHAIELTVSTTYTLAGSNQVEDITNVMLAYGRRFRTLFDVCQAAFGGLTRLTMKNMQLRGPDFQDILTVCTRLEMLSLDTCDPGPRVLWRVRHARLAELTITCCCFGGIDLAWLPRLERFTYRVWWLCAPRPLMSLGHVPRLTTVTLSNDQMISQPTLKLSQILANNTDAVTDLRLNFKGQDIWVKPEGPKRFTNMFCNLNHIKIRNLHEDCGLSWVSFLLQASPGLKELHIKLWDHECGMKKNGNYFATKKTNVPWEVATGFKHYGLTRVTIQGLYNKDEKVLAYIRHLVEVAVNLEEIKMRKNKPCMGCGITRTGLPRTDEEKDSLRHRISGGERAVAFKISIQY